MGKLLFFAFTVFCFSSYAKDNESVQMSVAKSAAPAYIALIIDDLGYRPRNDRRALSLDGEIAYAFLPGTPLAKKLATQAHNNNKVVILHMPMQAETPAAEEKNVLTVKMEKEQFIQTIEKGFLQVPFASGINNHMGSLLTQSEKHMRWLMSYLAAKDKQLFFIDSRTTKKTIAEQIANEYQISNTRRNVFLDHEHSKEAIEKQFRRLIALAKKYGSALAIGHPFSVTLDFLQEKLPELQNNGIKLISVTRLIKIQQNCTAYPCKMN